MFRALVVTMLVAGVGIGALMPSPEPVAAPVAVVASPQPGPTAGPPPLATELTRDASGHFYVTAAVNGQPVRFIVDTGASVVALTMDDARRIGVAFNPAAFTVVGTGASGPVRGQQVTLRSIRIDQKEAHDVVAVVLDHGLPVSLLGQNALGRLGSLAISGDRMTLR